MTRFLQPKFSVGGSSSDAYRDNWERIFGKKENTPEGPPACAAPAATCRRCDAAIPADCTVCASCADEVGP